MSSLEIDGFDPDDYNIQTLDSLTEVMHDYYQKYIVDSKEDDILECYKNNVNFVKGYKVLSLRTKKLHRRTENFLERERRVNRASW